MAIPKDNVVREFATINNRYRVRLLATQKGHQILDIREYLQDHSFEGFTRRGIRLNVPDDVMTLTAILSQVQAAEPERKEPPKGGKKRGQEACK